MINLILKLIPRKKLWEYVLSQEGFTETTRIENNKIWQEVFNKTPQLKAWLQKRSVMILKSVTLKDKDTEFLRGQLAENYIYQSFDIPTDTPKVEITKEEEKRLPLKDFLNRWTNGNKKPIWEEARGVDEKS